MGLFNFLADAGNHEERAVARNEEGDLFIDTCRVSDSEKPFETAIAHPDYNDNKLVIVELYDTKEEALEGHKRWLDKMLSNPPQQLVDISTATAANLLRAIDALPPCERKCS